MIEAPATLFAPRILWRVLRAGGAGAAARQLAPAQGVFSAPARDPA